MGKETKSGKSNEIKAKAEAVIALLDRARRRNLAPECVEAAMRLTQEIIDLAAKGE